MTIDGFLLCSQTAEI